jgi:uncharacterized protein YkwD
MSSLIDKAKAKLHHSSNQGNSVEQADPQQPSQETKHAEQLTTEPTSETNDTQTTADEPSKPTSDVPEQQGGSSDDPEGAISTHNNAREQKGTKALQWDDKLAKEAEDYAKELAKKNTMVSRRKLMYPVQVY